MLNYNRLQEDECVFYNIASTGELPNGERLFFEIGELALVLFNIAGRYYCISDVCTHDNGPLGDGELDGTEVVCPRHGARFDVTSGKATRLPAVKDIPAFPVRVSDEGMIQVGVPKG
jgi:3-phenylpropionate/trans-cinnamate dioxygenase ferredoxin subunit